MQTQILRASRKKPFRVFLFPVCLTGFPHEVEESAKIGAFFGGIRGRRIITAMGALVAGLDR